MKIMPSKWKVVQAKNKTKQRTALAVKTLFLIFVLLLLGFVVNIVRNLSEPVSFRGFDKSYSWEGDFKLNLIIRGDETALLSYDPQEQSIVIIKVPGETYIEVPGSFGSWQVRSIFDLGELERQNGGRMLARSLGNFFGAPVDGFIESLGEMRQKSAYELISSLRSNPLNALQFLGNSKISLNTTETMRLLIDIYRVRFDKISVIDLKKDSLLTEQVLPDGALGLIGDPVKIDGFAGKIFLDQKIRAEEKTVAVFNASKKPGVAQKASQLITHLGGNVIFAANAGKKIQTSVVISKDLDKAATYKRLSQIFAPPCLRTKCAILDDPEIVNSRADINVVLGEDF